MSDKTVEKGRMTLPVEQGIEKELKGLIRKWGADAVRNSDGTELPPDLTDLGLQVYSTLCMVRADQDYVKANLDKLQQKYLCSEFITATSDSMDIDPLKEYFKDQFAIDTDHDPKKWWEVMDRTTNEPVDPAKWNFEKASGLVKLKGIEPYHQYSVSFLVYQIWDSTSMYNALINDWEGEHTKSIDPYQPDAYEYMLSFLDKWLKDNPRTDVVRFTSVAYHFSNIYGHDAKPKHRDWSGYTDCISPQAIDDFENEKGYRLRPEDFVRNGTLNDANMVPSKAYLDWIDFMNAFVTRMCTDWVTKVHEAGKKAMMFFCDHWIGTEPYSDRYASIGFDAIVNATYRGVEVRRVGDVPAKLIREVRLYPYFFPLNINNEPSFVEGGNPAKEAMECWTYVRRGLTRVLVDRIGFGGYPSLALKFPDFVDTVQDLANEFRTMHENTGQAKGWTAPIKVGIINAWGKIRSWICGEYEQGGLMESICGLNVEVCFLSLADIAEHGLPSDVQVLINTGNADSAWSGGEHWLNEKLTTAIRKFIAQGGGLIGIGEPTAHESGGRFFQLSDILGVDMERNLTKGKQKPAIPTTAHFITKDRDEKALLGKSADKIYAWSRQTEVLMQDDGGVKLAVNTTGTGRAVYLAGYSLSWQNIRLIRRAIFWAAAQEDEFQKWSCSNPYAECAAYPDKDKVFVYNNTEDKVQTTVYGDIGQSLETCLKPYESKWFVVSDFK